LAISSDNGKPFVFENPDSTIAKEYTEISKKIVDLS
jgi:MinD-like ATPase involved in chromosome partitioning or flagellar assembly